MKPKKQANTRSFDAEWARERNELVHVLPTIATSRQRWSLAHWVEDERLGTEDAFEQMVDMASGS